MRLKQEDRDVKPSAKPSLVPTQHLPHITAGQTRWREIASPGFRVRTSGYGNRRLSLWAIRGPDQRLAVLPVAWSRWHLSWGNAKPGPSQVHEKSIRGP